MLLDVALGYAARGWSIVPCIPGSKLPDAAWKQYQERRASEDEIRRWFAPGHRYEAMAVVLGGISQKTFVRDFDAPGSYEEWVDKNPEIAQVLPTVKTRRGAHVYARMSSLAQPVYRNGRVIKYADGELRLSCCIVLLPPSKHPDGPPDYEWVIPLPPGDLLEIDPEEHGLVGVPVKPVPVEGISDGSPIPAGQRHTTLVSMAGTMRRLGMGPGEILAALSATNAARVRPPYPEKDIAAIAKDIGAKPTPIDGSGEATLICLNSVPRETVTFLWKPFLPKGKLAFLDGDPGVGKTWLGLAIAGAISRGFPLPDHTGTPPQRPCDPPGTVIYMNAEDGLGDTLAPRLDRLYADTSRIYAMNSIRCQKGADVTERSLTLSDIHALEQKIASVQPTLVIVDPLQSFLGANVDMHRANETRPILDALGRLAARHSCTVLIMRHMRKSSSDKAIYRGIGSIDFAGAARSIMVAERDPDDRTKRILAHAKCSVAQEAESLVFEISDQGEFLWCGPSSKTADSLQSQPLSEKEESSLDKATSLLSEILGPSPLASEDVKSQAHKAGISPRTLRRARERLNVFIRYINGISCWSLNPNPE